ncbi:unnamed protein product [Ixodes pacificus]
MLLLGHRGRIRQAIVERSIVFRFRLFAFPSTVNCRVIHSDVESGMGNVFGTGTTRRDGPNGNFFSRFFSVPFQLSLAGPSLHSDFRSFSSCTNA